KIDMKNYKEKNEELLLELARQEEIKNKKIMTSMWVILITNAIFYLGILFLAVNLLEEGVLLGTVISVSTIVFVIAAFIALKLEVEAGYYECRKCHHRFVSKYIEALMVPHVHTTRYLKCPKCKKRSWAKKVLNK
ncbi:MAG: DNA-binding protein, partial [Bacilli bacterium]|nr:DNA-binding protein [Bacilli bacterium]